MKLTKAEEQIMHIIWQLEKGFIKDILEEFDDPKPAYTTVATVVKILGKEGFCCLPGIWERPPVLSVDF